MNTQEIKRQWTEALKGWEDNPLLLFALLKSIRREFIMKGIPGFLLLYAVICIATYLPWTEFLIAIGVVVVALSIGSRIEVILTAAGIGAAGTLPNFSVAKIATEGLKGLPDIELKKAVEEGFAGIVKYLARPIAMLAWGFVALCLLLGFLPAKDVWWMLPLLVVAILPALSAIIDNKSVAKWTKRIAIPLGIIGLLGLYGGTREVLDRTIGRTIQYEVPSDLSKAYDVSLPEGEWSFVVVGDVKLQVNRSDGRVEYFDQKRKAPAPKDSLASFDDPTSPPYVIEINGSSEANGGAFTISEGESARISFNLHPTTRMQFQTSEKTVRKTVIKLRLRKKFFSW